MHQFADPVAQSLLRRLRLGCNRPDAIDQIEHLPERGRIAFDARCNRRKNGHHRLHRAFVRGEIPDHAILHVVQGPPAVERAARVMRRVIRIMDRKRIHEWIGIIIGRREKDQGGKCLIDWNAHDLAKAREPSRRNVREKRCAAQHIGVAESPQDAVVEEHGQRLALVLEKPVPVVSGRRQKVGLPQQLQCVAEFDVAKERRLLFAERRDRANEHLVANLDSERMPLQASLDLIGAAAEVRRQRGRQRHTFPTLVEHCFHGARDGIRFRDSPLHSRRLEVLRLERREADPLANLAEDDRSLAAQGPRAVIDERSREIKLAARASANGQAREPARFIERTHQEPLRCRQPVCKHQSERGLGRHVERRRHPLQLPADELDAVGRGPRRPHAQVDHEHFGAFDQRAAQVQEAAVAVVLAGSAIDRMLARAEGTARRDAQERCAGACLFANRCGQLSGTSLEISVRRNESEKDAAFAELRYLRARRVESSRERWGRREPGMPRRVGTAPTAVPQGASTAVARLARLKQRHAESKL